MLRLSSEYNGLGILFIIPSTIVAIVMICTVIKANHGTIISINTIRAVGLAGILISLLMLISTISMVGGIVLLIAAILYSLSTKNIKLAKIAVIIAGIEIVVSILTPFIIVNI